MGITWTPYGADVERDTITMSSDFLAVPDWLTLKQVDTTPIKTL